MPSTPQTTSVGRALTLVETMVAVAIIAVLLAILLSSVRGIRKRSESALDLSNLRQTMTDFAAWSNDHKGAMVNAGLPEDHDSHWFYGPMSGSPSARALYRSQMFVWPRVLYHWSGESSPAWHSVLGPSTLDGQMDSTGSAWQDPTAWHSLPSRFRYSETMLTSAAVWRPWERSLSGEEYALSYRVVRFDEIMHTATKGVLVCMPEDAEQNEWLASFADGHAEQRDRQDFKKAIPHPTSNSRKPGKPILHTLEGSSGRDI